MKKKLIVLVCLLFIFCSISCTANNTTYSQNSAYTNEISEELTIINIFEDFGLYGEDTYSFKKYDTVGNCSFLYSFSYSPTMNLYNCSVLATTTAYYAMYDYGSITFSWGNMEKALFYGYHELDNIAIIELYFSSIKLNSNISLGSTYSYQVTKNTFINLNKKEDIDEYASYSFECMNRAIGYAQSILYTYTDNITLW